MIGFWEILLILGIVLLLFGPKRLPELARGLGEAMSQFRKASKETPESSPKTKIEHNLWMHAAQKLGIETEGKTEEETIKEILRITLEEKSPPVRS